MRGHASLFGRRRILAAAAAAGGVLAFAAAQELAGAGTASVFGAGTALVQMYLGFIRGGAALLVFGYHLPFAVGAFASLWLAAPIAAELRFAQMVARAALATGIGAGVLLIVRTAFDPGNMFSGVRPLFGNSFPALPLDTVAERILFGAQGSMGVFIHQLPAVILAGVLLWLWLAKHTSRRAVSSVPVEV